MASKQFRVSGTDLNFLEKLAKEGDIPLSDVVQMAMTIGSAHLRQVYRSRVQSKGYGKDER